MGTVDMNRQQGPSRRRGATVAATVLLGVPAILLLVLGVGEMIGGDMSGFQHVVESAALIALMHGAWRYPRAAGVILVAGAVLLFVAWLALMSARGELGELGLLGWLTVGLLLFLPPLLAGWLLLRASRSNGS